MLARTVAIDVRVDDSETQSARGGTIERTAIGAADGRGRAGETQEKEKYAALHPMHPALPFVLIAFTFDSLYTPGSSLVSKCGCAAL